MIEKAFVTFLDFAFESPYFLLCNLDYLCHTYVRTDGLAGVLVADHEYPARVAFTVLTKVY